MVSLNISIWECISTRCDRCVVSILLWTVIKQCGWPNVGWLLSTVISCLCIKSKQGTSHPKCPNNNSSSNTLAQGDHIHLSSESLFWGHNHNKDNRSDYLDSYCVYFTPLTPTKYFIYFLIAIYWEKLLKDTVLDLLVVIGSPTH